MTLRGRVIRLESRRGASSAEATGAGATQLLCDRLERIAAAVEASGDLSHKSEASPAENIVRAWMRGETDLGDALRAWVERNMERKNG